MLHRLLTSLSKASFALTLAAAPWVFGGYPLWARTVLYGGICVALACYCLACLLPDPEVRPWQFEESNTQTVPWIMLPLLVLIGVGAVQCVPVQHTLTLDHAVLAPDVSDDARRFATANGELSIDPGATRLRLMDLVAAAAALFLAAQLMGNTGRPGFLLATIACSGGALAVFGIVQKLTWNGGLFWTIVPTQGGSPFASFVNRNNAAGYLNLALAASLALLVKSSSRPEVGAVGESRDLIAGRSSRPVWWTTSALIVAGIVVAMSRGAWIASAIAVGAVLIVVLSRAPRLWVPAATAVGLLIAAAVTAPYLLGVDEELTARARTVSSDLLTKDQRLTHWADMLPSLRDLPPAGFGLGSYRHVSRPYQSTDQFGWYYNADNHFFETLVETGVVGLVSLTILFAMLLVSSVRCFGGRDSGEPWSAALGIAGLVAGVTQFVQGGTDFGLIMPANALTFSALAGLVATQAYWCRSSSLSDRRASRFRFAGAAVAGLAAVALLLGGWQLTPEIQVESLVRQSPDFTRVVSTSEERLEQMEAEAGALLHTAPTNADLHRLMGELKLTSARQRIQARLGEFEERRGREPDALTTWQATSLPALVALATRYRADQPNARLQEMGFTEETITDLRSAFAHFVLSAESAPLAAENHYSLAHLTVLLQVPGQRLHLERAALLAPSNNARLAVLAALADSNDEEVLAATCLRRTLLLAPERTSELLPRFSGTFSEADIVRTVLPDSFEALLGAFEHVQDEAAAEALSERAAQVLDEKTTSLSDAAELQLRGRLEAARGDHTAAIALFQKSADLDPVDVTTHVLLSDSAAETGDLNLAFAHLQTARRLAPHRPDIDARVDKLARRSDDSPLRPPATN